MPLSEVLLLAIVFYLLYRFVFHFLLPIARTTRHVRQQFRNMQGGMGQEQQTQPNPQQPKRPVERHSSPHGPAEDYIDFEEIKEK